MVGHRWDLLRIVSALTASNMSRQIILIALAATALQTIAAAPGPQAPRASASTNPLDLIREDLRLTEVTMDDIMMFLNSEASAQQFSDCFIDTRSCPHKATQNIIRQVKAFGIDGSKTKLNQDQKDKTKMVIFDFIATFMKEHPKIWRQVFPHLGRLAL